MKSLDLAARGRSESIDATKATYSHDMILLFEEVSPWLI